MSLKVGEILVKQGLLRPDQLSQVIDEHKRTNTRVTTLILTMGLLKENQILRAMEKNYGIPGVDVSSFDIDAELLRIIPKELCEKNSLLPIQKAGQTLVIAFVDPSNLMLREDLRYLTKSKIQPVVGTEHAIHTAIDKYYGSLSVKQFDSMEEEVIDDGGNLKKVESIDEAAVAEDSPIVKFINAVLADSIRKRASDIHFEPYEKRYRVRFRVDGNLIDAANPPPGSGAAIASRIKILAKLDIAERRRPQDGRLKVKTKTKEIDFRVSILPCLWGEKVVLRLLDKSNLQLDMTKLGFESDDLEMFKKYIHMPQGIVLITGPTGSGKTTTIYSALADLNTPDVNISTAEDPVEFNLDGINQVQMNSEVGLDFPSALRSFLRQDPDIILVGEIRDLETAEIAFKAASTGHLVVSTLHTNDAPSTVLRLTEIGIAPYVITSTVNIIAAQRLVGKICDNCKAPVDVPVQTLLELGVPQAEVSEYKVFKGKGCINCNNTGYRGRLAIYEFMTMTEPIKESILKGANAGGLRGLLNEMNFRTLRKSALLKLKRGQTTIEEVLNSSVKDV